MHKDFYKIQEELKKNTIYQENKKNLQKIFDILDWNNRANWYNEIVPMIESVDNINRISIVSKDDKTDFYSETSFAFIPEELDVNYNWKFDIGDIVTDGNDIMVIIHLPEIHPKNNDYEKNRVMFNGNTYWIIRLDENGEDKDANDSTYYLHNFYNENQIKKVDAATSKFWKDKIRGKTFDGVLF